MSEITIYCPKLKRNVRLDSDGFSWEAEFSYGSYEVFGTVNCKCGGEHKINLTSFSEHQSIGGFHHDPQDW